MQNIKRGIRIDHKGLDKWKEPENWRKSQYNTTVNPSVSNVPRSIYNGSKRSQNTLDMCYWVPTELVCGRIQTNPEEITSFWSNFAVEDRVGFCCRTFGRRELIILLSVVEGLTNEILKECSGTSFRLVKIVPIIIFLIGGFSRFWYFIDGQWCAIQRKLRFNETLLFPGHIQIFGNVFGHKRLS